MSARQGEAATRLPHPTPLRKSSHPQSTHTWAMLCSSPFTAMRSAWKVRVAGCLYPPPLPPPPLPPPPPAPPPMARTSCWVVVMGAASRASTILRARAGGAGCGRAGGEDVR